MPAPSDELDAALASGEVVLGGCTVEVDAPPWHCNDCGMRWGALPPGFARFELSETHSQLLGAHFEMLLDGTDLSGCERMEALRRRSHKAPGIYLWLIRHEGRMFRIYAGKTNSLALRLHNYVSAFQPHSPNDFKLQVFRDFMQSTAPGAHLDLWFMSTGVHELTEREKWAIDAFDPLLNQRMRPAAEAKANLKAEFARYYGSAFSELLARK